MVSFGLVMEVVVASERGVVLVTEIVVAMVVVVPTSGVVEAAAILVVASPDTVVVAEVLVLTGSEVLSDEGIGPVVEVVVPAASVVITEDE